MSDQLLIMKIEQQKMKCLSYGSIVSSMSIRDKRILKQMKYQLYKFRNSTNNKKYVNPTIKHQSQLYDDQLIFKYNHPLIINRSLDIL